MSATVFERIQGEIDANPVMLYMKGNPMFPQCGFSARVVQILTHIRCRSRPPTCWRTPSCARASRRSANWPTVPQLYVKGELVGGCDIVTEMYQSGELETLLAEKGVQVSA